MAKYDKIKIENARIVFRNFRGEEKKSPNGKIVNRKGQRNFSVVIEDPVMAEELAAEGWNIKHFRPREDEEDEPGAYLPVKVSFDKKPPHIYMVSGKTKKLLDEETVGTVDIAEIASVDLTITPYNYEVDGRSGISAYVKTMFINIVEDDFASKYDFGDDEEEEVPFE